MQAVSTTVLYAVAITMVVVGSLNIYEVLPGCRAQPQLPNLNIFGGSIIMVGLFIREIIKRLCECCNDCFDYDRCCRIGGKVLKCSLLMIYDLGFMVVSLIWLIVCLIVIRPVLKPHLPNELHEQLNTALEPLNDFANGVIGVFNVDEVTQTKQQLSQEIAVNLQGDVDCDDVLFHVTLVVMVAGWIVLALGVLYFIFFKFLRHVLCCKICREERPPPHHVYASV